MKTAVEWLAEELRVQFGFAFSNNILEQAIELEKQQIIDCGNSCAIQQVIHNRKVDLMNLEQLEEFALEENLTFGEQYYNEIFKNEK